MTEEKGVGDLALDILESGVAGSSPKSPAAAHAAPDVSNEAMARLGIDSDNLIKQMIQETTTVGQIGANLAGSVSKESSKDNPYTNPLEKKRKGKILTLKVKKKSKVRKTV